MAVFSRTDWLVPPPTPEFQNFGWRLTSDNFRTVNWRREHPFRSGKDPWQFSTPNQLPQLLASFWGWGLPGVEILLRFVPNDPSPLSIYNVWAYWDTICVRSSSNRRKKNDRRAVVFHEIWNILANERTTHRFEHQSSGPRGTIPERIRRRVPSFRKKQTKTSPRNSSFLRIVDFLSVAKEGDQTMLRGMCQKN